jgi:CHRD domain-containing protein
MGCLGSATSDASLDGAPGFSTQFGPAGPVDGPVLEVTMHSISLALRSSLLALGALLLGASVALGAGRPFMVQLAPQAGGDADGSGLAVLTMNPGTGQVCYTITVENIGVPTEPAAGLGAAHIHDEATGGIFIDLETNWTASNGGFAASGCTATDREHILAIFMDPSAYYVNIHTVDFPGGAIRGQLG